MKLILLKIYSINKKSRQKKEKKQDFKEDPKGRGKFLVQE